MAIMIFTLLIVGVFVLWDAVPMYKNKEWKHLVVYICLMLIVVSLVFLKQIIHLHLPSPTKPFKEILIAIFGEK